MAAKRIVQQPAASFPSDYAELLEDLKARIRTARVQAALAVNTTEFRPEYAGKLNFYLSAVDDLLRHPQDNPTVGILLCKEKNRVVVEYALRDVSKPLGVAEYRLAQALPAELQGALPSVEELEAELAKLDEGNLEEQGNGG